MARTKKEQMQIMILGAVVAGGALFAAVNFLLVPVINNWKKDAEQTRLLREKLEGTRIVVRQRADVLSQVDDERRRIAEMAQHIPLPVLGNYLLGMEAQVRDCATLAGLKILTVAASDVAPVNYAENVCQLYRVRVTAEGDLNALVDFMERGETMNPLATVAALNITARPGSPATHQISMVMGWLVWAKPDKLPDYMAGLPAETSE